VNAKYLISNTSTPDSAEKTEVISGVEEAIKRTLHDFSLIREKIDSCIDITGPSIILSVPPIKGAFLDLKRRGIKIRFITEITKYNLRYCTELQEFGGEVRHLDDIKGNFGVTEYSYIGNAVANENNPLPEMVISTVKSFVEQQQYFFDMLWKKAIPIRKRIKELEEGWRREYIETIQDPLEIINVIRRTINNASEEILVIIPNESILEMFEKKLKFTEKLRNLVRNSNISIQILIHIGKINHIKKRERINHLLGLTHDHSKQVRIQEIKNNIYDRIGIIIVDRDISLAIESRESVQKTAKYSDIDEEEIFQSIGLATYSNSESTVLSYITIFETLWIKSDVLIDK
jgi:two-component system, OmpR family, sensor histidine kinase VicK